MKKLLSALLIILLCLGLTLPFAACSAKPSTVAPGFSNDKEEPKSTSDSSAAATEASVSEGQLIAIDQTYTLKTDGEAAWQLKIPQGIFAEEKTLKLKPLNEEEKKPLLQDGMSLLGNVVDIKIADAQSVRLNAPVQLSMTLPDDQIPTEADVDNLFAAYWTGTKWEYIFPDLSELYDGKVSFTSYHFSWFGTAQLTDAEKIKLYMKKMAVQTWEQGETEKNMSEKLQSSFNEAFTQLGIEDDTIKGELFRYISKQTDFGTLLVAAQDGDLADFGSKCGEMAANAVLEKFYQNNNFVDNIAGKAGAAAGGLFNAALKLKDGNYTDATKELSKAFINYFPVGAAYTSAIEVINASVSSWKDYEMESAYQIFTGLAQKGTYGLSVDPNDWEGLLVGIDPYVRQLQSEAKDLYCKVNNISRSDLDKDAQLSERIAADTVNNLKKMFEKRMNAQAEIEAKEAEIQKLIEGFENDGLLDRGHFKFESRDDIQDRLRSLFKIRNNILEMVGGQMPYEMGENPESNMNLAISEWLVRGTKDRAGFYEWMIEKGYLKRQESGISGVYNVTGTYTWAIGDGDAETDSMTPFQMRIEQTETSTQITFLDKRAYILSGSYDPTSKTFTGQDKTTQTDFWTATPWQVAVTTIRFTIDGQNVSGVGQVGWESEAGVFDSTNMFNFNLVRVSD